ncbi:MAG: alanine racemase [Gammaproteobacteria bacterium]|nr:alanine racemase [Gammaproteobacteria bacterium]
MNSHGSNRHSYVIIDLAAIRHNYHLLKQISGGKRLIAVIKADAYGHGAVEVAKALSDADAFAVAAVGEAVALREAGIMQKILVLGGFIGKEELSTCIQHQFDPVIHQQTHLDLLHRADDLKGLQVWVKVDTGMGRLGYALEIVTEVVTQLEGMSTLGAIHMMSHLANADNVESDFSNRQIAAIQALRLDSYEWGVANSAGVLGWPASHDTWVRAGIAMYGANPMSNRKETNVDLKPAMQMKSRILAVNPHKQGDVIGYANLYTCPKDMDIAAIATGYADGYPRHKVETAQVSIHGQLCDIVGRVSMDMITVDVSGLKDIQPGDDVTLFGTSPEVNHVADCAQTIAYEVLCNVGAHVRREYINIT